MCVCVAGLFGVYGGGGRIKGFTGLSGSTWDKMPFQLFFPFFYNCFGWLQTDILEESRTRIVKLVSVLCITVKNITRQILKNFFFVRVDHFLSSVSAKFIFYGFNFYIWT